jgi:uncharacterized membrane protein/protein-disulfide isomerase
LAFVAAPFLRFEFPIARRIGEPNQLVKKMSIQETSPSQPRRRVWLMRWIAFCGLAFALYLAWSTVIVGSVAGCGDGRVMDCNHVLQSKFAKVFGMPVSIPAAVVYVVLLISLFVAASHRRSSSQIGWVVASVCILSAGFAAIWFVAVQAFLLHKICWYCLVVHSCGLVLCSLLLWIRPFDYRRLSQLAVPGMLAAITVAVIQYHSPEVKTFEVITDLAASETGGESMVFDMSFAVGPVVADALTNARADASFVDEATATYAAELHPANDVETALFVAPAEEAPFAASAVDPVPAETESTAFEVPSPSLSPAPVESADAQPVTKAKRYVDFKYAKVKLNTYDWPILGSPEAPYVVLELFDYTCSHCQQMNQQLTAARKRYGQQFAILTLPVPLNRDCNPHYTRVNPRHADACELARLALSIWHLAPESFDAFHEWLFVAKPDAIAARLHAETIVDPAALRDYVSGAHVSRYITAHANILQQAGGPPLPRIESEQFSLKGKTNAAQDLFNTLENRLGMQP